MLLGRTESVARPDDRAPRRAVPVRVWLVVGAGFVLFAGWQLLHLGGNGSRSAMGATASLLIPSLAGVVAAWQASRRCAADPRTASAWRWLALSIGSLAAAFIARLVYQGTGGGVPFPSLVDVFFLAFYPLFLAGVLRFPTGSRSRHGSATLALDVVTAGLGGACVIWYLVLGPTVTSRGDLLPTLVAGASPVGDLLQLFGLTYVFLRTYALVTRRPITLLLAGTCAAVVSDVMYGWLSLHPDARGSAIPNVGWMAGFLLYMLAAMSQDHERLEEQHERSRRATWLPYLAPVVIFGLLIYVQRDAAFFPDLSILMIAALVGGIVLSRQFLAQRDLIAAHRQLAAVATTDPLTGLPNHRALAAAIDQELGRSERYEHTCAVLFFDVDHFKRLNDSAGHAAGDAALSELARLSLKALRTIDTVGRWGGEEFVAILPEIDHLGAMASAERLRATIAEHRFGAETGLHCTVSVGVAVYPENGRVRSELLEAADRAMYGAKRLGRNQTLSAADPALRALPSSAEYNDSASSAAEALGALVAARDTGTGSHSNQVAVLAERVALTLGCSLVQAHGVYLAAKLHDIGKVAIADAILRKPGALTPEEWELMKQHPTIGADIVQSIGHLADLAPIIRAHHERYDGAGYPEGLEADEIPIEARIVGVADAFDAMISDRPYRAGMKLEQAREELRRCAGTQFDPTVIAALDRILDEEPVRDAA